MPPASGGIRLTLVPLVVFVALWLFVLIRVLHITHFEQTPELTARVDEERHRHIAQLEKRLADEVEQSRSIASRAERVELENQALKRRLEESNGLDASKLWTEPIAVLVFACNRPLAVQSLLNQLLRYRHSVELFPIFVSNDCEHDGVAAVARSFGSNVTYLAHAKASETELGVSPKHRHYASYYKISRHYKLALREVFDKGRFSSVIILEDDLDVSSDFFAYFAGTRWLLDADPSLYCVSAWNDNGKPWLVDWSIEGARRLHRSDFFPGLGWMLTSAMWKEFGGRWPSGFWDDWVREPEQRRDRACIRPELSRTAMSEHGKKGASQGLFFTKHLAKVKLCDMHVDFTALDTTHLLKENYDTRFLAEVYKEAEASQDAADAVRPSANDGGGARRVEYDSLASYLRSADKFGFMRDFKAGVPRTAYIGVVSGFVQGRRVFLARNTTAVTRYDRKWEASAE